MCVKILIELCRQVGLRWGMPVSDEACQGLRGVSDQTCRSPIGLRWVSNRSSIDLR